MKYSKLFGKTNRSAKEYASKNATLLQKAGFIDQVMSGVYTYLPLGNRVLSKIEKIVREEMDKIGNEVFMPAIVPFKLWEDTNRLDKVDVLFKATGANELSKKKNNTEYVLNSTHEEVVTPLAKKFNSSHKDLPFALYQIQTKFRNEPRAKSGLMRGREFRMKDLYSFHKDEGDLLDYYENKAIPAYQKVFERLGIGDLTVIALASGGDFTEKYSHEFQTKCSAGEDTIFYVKSTNTHFNKEVASSKAPNVSYKDDKMLAKEDIYGQGIIGVEELSEFLKIPVEKTTKTLIFTNENDDVIVAAVRGGYDVDEEKLKKIVGCKKLELASQEVVEKTTGAQTGYAGIVNLPENIILVIDESCDNRLNFETGANKTNYHSVNVNWDRDIAKPEKFYDIKIAKDGDLYPETGEKYEVFSAAEVGNIFPLNIKFSQALDYKYTDENGDQKLVYMGCYGIGTSRIMGVLAELFHDEKGIIWPESIAPYQIHLINLGDDTKNQAQEIYENLTSKGVEVLWDDRDESAGVKFSDADLIGIPTRVVVSKRLLQNNQVEIKKRNSEELQIDSIETFLSTF